MKSMLTIALFLVLLLCFLANPAPLSIELADIVLVLLSCTIGMAGLAFVRVYAIGRPEAVLLVALVWYLAWLLLSTLAGLLQGVPLLNVLRSTGPYASFFPLIFAGFIPAKNFCPKTLVRLFVIAGLIQSAWLVWLYVSHAGHSGTTAEVLRSRITLKDPRTTLPLLLSAAIFPMLLVFSANSKKIMLPVAGGLVMFAFFSGILTLTRAIVLAILMGWMILAVLNLYYAEPSVHGQRNALINRLIVRIFCLVAALWAISNIPAIHVTEKGLMARFFQSSASGARQDYTDGRLFDEWVPALSKWKNSGPAGIIFGIGAGNSFTVLTGEERTYIHNLCIYTLVYGGIFGLTGCILLYVALFKTLLLRAAQTRDPLWLGCAALLASLLFYAQLFAVHKGLAFNAMLFMMVAIALIKPVKEENG